MEEQRVDISAYFRGLMMAAPAEAERTELMLSRILCCGNLMVVMSYIRRMAYESLLDISRTASRFLQHAMATLQGVVHRLGLKSLASLFQTFVGYYAYRKSNTLEQDFYQQLPVQICGFTTNSARAEAVFDQLGAFYLSIEDQGRFVSLRKQAGIPSNAEALRRCFPAFVAQSLLDTAQTCFEVMEDASEALKATLERVKAAFESSEQTISFETYLASSVDRVISCVLERLHASTFDASSTVSTVLSAIVRARTQNPGMLFHSLVAHVSPDPIYSHGLDYEPTPCLQVCMQLIEGFTTSEQLVSISYNVFRHLLSSISKGSFLDEQRRLFGCLAVACVIFMDSLPNPAITRLLAHGSASLYTKEDILQQSFSLFMTVVALYLQTLEKQNGAGELIKTLPALVIQTARIALAYQKHGVGTDHLARLDRTLVARLARSSDQRLCHQSTLVSVLWPDDVSRPLSVSLPDFSIIVKHAEASGSSALHLIEPLWRFVQDETTDLTPLQLGRLLWSVLISPNNDNGLSSSSATALASLLSQSRGQVIPPELSASRQRAGQLLLPLSNFTLEGLQDLLVEKTADLLLDSDLSVNDAAAKALRRIFDTAQPGRFETSVSLSDTARDVICLAEPSLRRYQAVVAAPKPVVDLDDLQTLGTFDQERGTQWCADIAAVLLSCLGQQNAFFLHLSPLLHCSQSFTREVLPVLVHALLSQQESFPHAVTALSALFNQVLPAPAAPKEAVGCIVDIMLYLRNFDQPESAGGRASFSGDRWLAVSWRTVALGSIRTHGSATALLCLELACEQEATVTVPEPSKQEVQRLQYDMYVTAQATAEVLVTHK